MKANNKVDKISFYDKTTILESLFGDPENEEINIAVSILDSISKVKKF